MRRSFLRAEQADILSLCALGRHANWPQKPTSNNCICGSCWQSAPRATRLPSESFPQRLINSTRCSPIPIRPQTRRPHADLRQADGYNVKDIIYRWARKSTAVERDKEISLPQFDIVQTVQKYRLEELSSGKFWPHRARAANLAPPPCCLFGFMSSYRRSKRPTARGGDKTSAQVEGKSGASSSPPTLPPN